MIRIIIRLFNLNQINNLNELYKQSYENMTIASHLDSLALLKVSIQVQKLVKTALIV